MKLAFHWQILIAIVLAVLAGLATSPDTVILGISLVSVYEFLGTLFLNALRMLIVPLIMSAIITGIVGIGNGSDLGRLGAKTITYYLSTSLLAILVGLILVNITQPGVVNGEPAKDLIGLTADVGDLAARIGGAGAGDVAQVFLRMVPPNIVSAAAEGQMLGLIFFSLLFGFLITRLENPFKDTLSNFWGGVYRVMLRMTELIMLFAPIGVFGLIARVVATTGLSAIGPLGVFFFTVLIALAAHFFITLALLLRFVGGINPLFMYRAMWPAILMAFSTSSSSATLPVTLDLVEKKVGVSNRTSSFVLPLGATVNMDGTALYECVAAMFIAQAYGLELTFAVQFTVVITALLTSIGVAGIPSASLVAIAVILGAIGLPLEGLALILAVDRILDMCRTSVNVFGDACGAAIIASTEGEKLAVQIAKP
jgi:proton glutamate symport protein